MTLSSLCEISATPEASIIAVDCELVRGEEAQFVEMLLPAVRRQSVRLNLARVERIDAAGIAALITLYVNAVEAGHCFTIIEPSSHVLDLLQIVGLASILMGESQNKSARLDRRAYSAA